MALTFAGTPLEKLSVSAFQYVALIMDSSNYTRGEIKIASSTGSHIKILGLTDGLNLKITPDKTYSRFGATSQVTKKFDADFRVFRNGTLSQLDDIANNEVTIFFAPTHQIQQLTGFDSTVYDFSAMTGICNAENVVHKTFLTPSYKSQNGELIEVGFKIENSFVNTRLFDNEPIGTYTAWWDWTGSSSLVDSVNSITLTNNGATYSTDKYVFDGVNDVMNAADNVNLNPTKGLMYLNIDMDKNGAGASAGLVRKGGNGSAGSYLYYVTGAATNRSILAYPDATAQQKSFTTFGSTTVRENTVAYINFQKRLLKIYNLTTLDFREQGYTTSPPVSVTDNTGAFYVGADVASIYYAGDIYKLGASK